MSEPITLLAVGDLHGDAMFTNLVFQAALDAGVDAIVQVGDFGYWEHMQGGAAFLDFCSQLATDNAMPLYWIDGNHENHTMLREQYGPGGAQHKPTPEGFWEIRDGVYYIPRGTRWVWSDKHLMGLGGAYSVDAPWRLEREHKAYVQHMESNHYRQKAGAPLRPFRREQHKLWWPEEQLTDEEISKAIADTTPLDILFTHDKPRGSNPAWNRKAITECLPNQDKISTVVRTLQPKLLVHGHLHFRYRDTIPCGDYEQYCRVEGLNCNTDARYGASDAYDGSAWMVIDLTDPVPDAD